MSVSVQPNIFKKTALSMKDSPSSMELKSGQKGITAGGDVNGESPIPNGYPPKPSGKKPHTDAYVGFSNLPNQVHRKAVRRGFEFNLMVVGESGLGKSTFVNSLFLSDIYNNENEDSNVSVSKTTSVRSQTYLLKELGVQLRLQLVDTPGFGDAVDNTGCWQPILDYINAQYDKYFHDESCVNRSLDNLVDRRIHALLYFFAPTGHTVKQLDLEVLRRIQGKVNIIPVIAKADTLTVDECKHFKEQVLKELASQGIQTFTFPDPSNFAAPGNAEDRAKITRLRDRAPFAVVGANTLITGENGDRVRARSYPWGVVEVENMSHNDFAALRYLLLTVYMQELRDITHNVLYEDYRHAKLLGIANELKCKAKDDKDPIVTSETERKDPMLALETARKEHEAKFKHMEVEMETVFQQKAQEKAQKLRNYEIEIAGLAEQLHEQIRLKEQELETARRNFEAERARWEENWRDWETGPDTNGTAASGTSLGDRVMNELVKDRTKTEKKRKGLF